MKRQKAQLQMTMPGNDDQISLKPQRGRYFARHRGFNAALRLIDALLTAAMWMMRPWRGRLSPRPVRRVLLTNGSHLGDIVLSTAILPVLKAAFPEVKVGMLVGGWAQPVVRDHPMLDWVHRVDHWRISRDDKPLRAKFAQWWRTRRQALRDIREVDYDVAIDLYFYFPGSVALLWQAGIPERIGYTSAGMSPLLTRHLDVDMARSRQSMVDYHLALVRLIPGIGSIDVSLARPVIPRRSVDVAALTGDRPYVVLHIGSGSALKDWPESAWMTLARQLMARGEQVVLTGSGERERAKVDRFMAQMPEAIDLCDRLKWLEFVEVIGGARLVVASDSVAAHIAAAVDTPVIVTGHGMTNPFLWRPASPRALVMVKPMPCAPCYRNSGCASMECLRGLPAEDVAREALRALDISKLTPEVAL